jgi:glycosyltransferase involved in cell wall biosynthesis
MKILHILKSMNPAEGGVVEFVTRTSAVLGTFGWTHEFLTLDRPDDSWVKSSPATVHAMGVHGRVSMWLQRRIPLLRYGLTPHLVPWLRDNVDRFDVVVVNGLWNFTALAARIVLPGRRPYIVFTHGMIDPWFRATYPLKTYIKQFFWWFIEGPLLSHARFVIFLAEEEKLLARNAFWPYRVTETVVGSGTTSPDISLEEQDAAFATAFPDLKQKRFLLFLSRIHQKKGCDLLLRAFAQIAKRDPMVELVMAGPDQVGWTVELKRLAQELSIANRVHWLGMVSGAAKWGAYRACEAFVLPSHSENFGVVVAEAMASGRPVLISDKVNIWREVKASGGGLVESDTVAGAVKLLSEFYSLSSEQKAAMGLAARHGFERYFDLRRTAVTFKEFLENNFEK